MIQRSREHILSAGSAAVLWVVVASLSGCGPEEVTEAAPVVRPIKMTEIGAAVSAVSRAYPGRVAPALEAELGFEVPGRISSFPVSEGQRVRKGQVLARLDPSDYQAQLAAAQADLNAAEADYERFRELLGKNAVSERDFQTRERNFEVAQARIRIAEKALGDTRLTAQFAGQVARKLVDDFQSVQAKQPVVLLQDHSHLEIKIDVPEADLALASADWKADWKLEFQPVVSVTAFPEHTFAAQFTEASTSADPVTRTFEATLAFKPEEVRVLPGMTASVFLSVTRSEADSPGYSIPSQSVATGDDGGAYVWKVNPQTLEVSRTAVQVGELTGGDILVRSGLARGDLVAVSGVHHLSEGMKVRRMEER